MKLFKVRAKFWAARTDADLFQPQSLQGLFPVDPHPLEDLNCIVSSRSLLLQRQTNSLVKEKECEQINQ